MNWINTIYKMISIIREQGKKLTRERIYENGIQGFRKKL